ncbi:glutamate receptor ionotropic, kainate glr-3-like [Argiope bruennichi]|uniref:Glutamate receptor ionotropic like protein n=1 Tax=Argiope bruennichi TaxID=94029 RepID=A0A8T0FS32_ARGBR|nr:glutamate receptor ionotropic, kainate glr-3-like [Argiope bruennichi]KAF8793891.1 Glutamate receptor ionotropic like protein [Argiope bruennichi]
MVRPPVRIAILQNGPFEVNLTSNGIVEVVDGAEANFLHLVTAGLKAPYVLQVPKDAVWGVPNVKGNWSGLMGMVQREEVDMAIGTIFISEKRMSVAAFSYPYTWQDVTFSTRKPGRLPKGMDFMWPFSYQVWICIAISIIVLTIAYRISMTKAYPLPKIFFGIIGILLRQSPEITCRSFRDRCLIISWIGGCTVLSYSYTVVLLSFLTVPLTDRPIETIPQLTEAVQQGRYKCIIPAGSSIVEILKSSKKKSDRILGYHISKTKGYVDLQIEGAVARHLKQGDVAYIDIRERMKIMFQNQFYISRHPLFSNPVAVALNRKFRYKKRLNKIIERITAAGLYEKSLGDYMYKKQLTSKYPDDSKFDDMKQLKMTDLYGAFVILICGEVLAILVFIGELLKFYYFKK